jgi:surfeit locus 1 family protein
LHTPTHLEGKPWCALTRVACTQPSYFTPDNRPDRGEWYYLDAQAMAAHAGTRPLLVEADTSLPGPPGGLPIAREAGAANIRNDHAQYALTWYALAGLTTALLVLRARGA